MIFFRPDTTVQRLVYKLVPGLFGSELRRRKDYEVQQMQEKAVESSKDSKEKVKGDGEEKKLIKKETEDISQLVISELESNVGPDLTSILASDDTVSLSIQYYKK